MIISWYCIIRGCYIYVLVLVLLSLRREGVFDLIVGY